VTEMEGKVTNCYFQVGWILQIYKSTSTKWDSPSLFSHRLSRTPARWYFTAKKNYFCKM